MGSGKMIALGHHSPALPAPGSWPHVQPCSLPTPQPPQNHDAVPLEAPRGPSAEHPAHNDPQVVAGHTHQVTCSYRYQATQPTPPPAARLANLRERPFHLLAAELLQPLAPLAPHPPPIVAVGPLPFRRLVRPHPLLRPVLLGGVRPQAHRVTVGQGLRFVVALVGRHLVN